MSRTLRYVTMHHLAAWPRDGHRGRCYATSVLTCSPLLRGQRQGVGATIGGEGERVFAVVSICVFALDLRGESASACSSRPICPVETSHPLTRDPNIDLPDMQTRRPANGRTPAGWSFVVAVLHGTVQLAIHVPFGDGVFLVIEPLAAHQGDLDLGETILQVHSQGHDRPASLSDLTA
jgi:hypothetical protein